MPTLEGFTLLSIKISHWIFAHGDSERLEVLRSPGLRDTDDWWQPVRQFIAGHGLRLSAQEDFRHPHFMDGGCAAEVYVSPAARNAGGIELLPSMDGFAGTSPEALTKTARECVAENWPFPPEADDYDDDDDDLNVFAVN